MIIINRQKMKWIIAIFILGLTLLNLDVAYSQQRYIDPEAFEKSYALWQEQKEKHNNSYILTLTKSSFSGWVGTTKLRIKNGVVVKRSYSERYLTPRDRRTKPIKWTEKGSVLGKHREGYPLVTLDEIYEYAESYLPDPAIKLDRIENNEERVIEPDISVYFETNLESLISLVGHRNNHCLDDCFRGFRVKDIKWLK